MGGTNARLRSVVFLNLQKIFWRFFCCLYLVKEIAKQLSEYYELIIMIKKVYMVH